MNHLRSLVKLRRAALIPLWGALSLVGCAEQAPPDSAAPPAAASAARETREGVAGETAPTDSPADDQKASAANAQDPAGAEAAAAFETPFPPRADLFAPPPRGGQTSIRTTDDGETVARVALKGFVNVGGQRAVLLIGDEIAPLGIGQERHGVRVIAIEPPQVTLQRGRTRWTESLQRLAPAR